MDFRPELCTRLMPIQELYNIVDKHKRNDYYAYVIEGNDHGKENNINQRKLVCFYILSNVSLRLSRVVYEDILR